MGMGSTGQSAGSHRPAGPMPRVVIVVGQPTRDGETYRVEAPDRVLRMFGMLTAARDELDLLSPLPASRARIQRLLDVVRAELERSVSDALAEELRRLVCRSDGVPGAADLRIEYASLLGWASGLVVAMLDQLAGLHGAAGPPRQSPATHAGQGHGFEIVGFPTGAAGMPKWPWMMAEIPRPGTERPVARLPSTPQRPKASE